MRTKTIYICEECNAEYLQEDWANTCEKSEKPILPAGIEGHQPVNVRRHDGTYQKVLVDEAEIVNKAGWYGNPIPGHCWRLQLDRPVQVEAGDELTKFVADDRLVSDEDAAKMIEYDPYKQE